MITMIRTGVMLFRRFIQLQLSRLELCCVDGLHDYNYQDWSYVLWTVLEITITKAIVILCGQFT